MRDLIMTAGGISILIAAAAYLIVGFNTIGKGYGRGDKDELWVGVFLVVIGLFWLLYIATGTGLVFSMEQ